jgi:hypothetical protein
VQNRNPDSLVTYQASADAVSAVFIPPAPAPLVAPRNIVPVGEEEVWVVRLPSLSC